MSGKNLREFPLAIFPQQIREIIEITSDELNFPVSYIAASLFLAVSVAIGNSRYLKVKEGWKVKPILYMALLGKPGAVKTHPINYALSPFRMLDNETLAKYAKELEEYRENSISGRKTKPKAKQIIVKDSTIEAITKVLLMNHHGICIHYDELNGWFNSFNRYHKTGGDEEQWLSMYSGDAIVVNRKTQDDILSVPNPFVCVIGSIQPNVLIKCFKGQKTDNGFLFRILFVENSSEDEAVLWKDDDLPSNSQEKWNQFLMEILNSSLHSEEENNALEYTFDESGWKLIKQWQNNMENEITDKGEEQDIAIFRKIQDYALRFCIPIHVMHKIKSDNRKIDCTTVIKATELAEYFYYNAKNVYDLIHFSSREDLTKLLKLSEMLPTVFTREQAIIVGNTLGLSRSTIFRHIRGDEDDLFFRRLSHGKYEKK